MRKNLKVCLTADVTGEAQCLADMNQFEMIEASGMTPDLRHTRSAHMTGAWNFSDRTRVSVPLGGADLSGFRFLTFSVFAFNGAGGSFSLFFDCAQKAAEGKNGYEITLPVTHDGWNDYRVELPFMRAIRQPTGWDKIGFVSFDSVFGGQKNRTETVLYIDSLFLRDENAAPLYTTVPELKGAAAFAKGGNFAIVNRRRIALTLDGAVASPVEQDGVWWIPMGPIAAVMAHTAVADNKALTLTFTYRRKKYAFSASSANMTVDGTPQPIGFRPMVRGGMLLFPADFVREFFRWRRIFTDPTGLIVFSNRRDIFDRELDEPRIWQLVADMTFARPTGNEMLDALHRRFPNQTRGKLLATYDELMGLRKTAKEDPACGELVAALKQAYGKGTPAFCAEPVAPDCGDPKRLAELSDALFAFATLYRVTGDKVYCERAAAECEAFAKMADFTQSPKTIAQIGFGLAVAYDWCHHVWSEARKAVVERALLRGVMRPGVEFYQGKRPMWDPESADSLVINMGMLAAAIAMADIYPETALKLLNRIPANAEFAMRAYTPDGGFAEGVGAWEKATRAAVLFDRILTTACGTDYGFSSVPGFAATTSFAIHTETPNGIWNFHNCASRALDTSVFAFFSQKNGDPVPEWIRRRDLHAGKKQVTPLDLLFYAPVNEKLKAQLPIDALYRKAGVAVLRSGFGPQDAVLGLHGGSNHAKDADLDAGTVLLEMGGVRFIEETGGRSDFSPIMLRRAEGQNTVVVNPGEETVPDQNPDAIAPIMVMRSFVNGGCAIADLTSTNDAIRRAKRGILLTDSRRVAVIQDEMTFREPAKVVWTLYTSAEVELSKSRKSAKLTKNGKVLGMKIFGVSAYLETETVGDGTMTRIRVFAEVKEHFRMAAVCKLLAEGEAPNAIEYEMIPMSKWETE